MESRVAVRVNTKLCESWPAAICGSQLHDGDALSCRLAFVRAQAAPSDEPQTALVRVNHDVIARQHLGVEEL